MDFVKIDVDMNMLQEPMSVYKWVVAIHVI